MTWVKLNIPGSTCEINRQGHVREKIHILPGGTVCKNRKLPVVKCGKGFYAITRWDGKKQRNYYIHRLVAVKFVPNPNGYSFVKFKDGDAGNYKASNLYWNPTP